MVQVYTELVVYQVRATALKDGSFSNARRMVQQELKLLQGFISHTSRASLNDPSCFFDLVCWRSEADAKAAMAAFRQFNSAEVFMSAIEKVQFSGLFGPKIDEQAGVEIISLGS